MKHTPIERAAIRWWKSRRPIGWTEAQHKSNPIINTATAPETHLAREIGKHFRRGR